MTPTIPDQIRAILADAKQRAEAATKGPWAHKSQDAENIYGPSPFGGEDEQIAMLMWPCHPPEKTEEAEKLWFDTGAFIADARTALPRQTEALELLLENLEKQIKRDRSAAKACRAPRDADENQKLLADICDHYADQNEKLLAHVLAILRPEENPLDASWLE